jgi:hypothetical protein
MKFDIDGREYEDYQLNNEQIVRLLNSEDITDMGYDFLMEKVLERFKNECCPNCGENNDNVFVRQFSSFVNGRCHNMNKVAELMANEHRYLQKEMFKVCLAYIKKLAENYENHCYDLRNEWACMVSFRIQGFIETMKY